MRCAPPKASTPIDMLRHSAILPSAPRRRARGKQDRHRPERPEKLEVTVPVPVSRRCVVAIIAPTAERRFHHLLNERPDLPPHSGLQRIEPVLAEEWNRSSIAKPFVMA